MDNKQLKQFKTWIEKEIGKKCDTYYWDCIICRSWRLYEELEAYLSFMERLDKYGIDGKKNKNT